MAGAAAVVPPGPRDSGRSKGGSRPADAGLVIVMSVSLRQCRCGAAAGPATRRYGCCQGLPTGWLAAIVSQVLTGGRRGALARWLPPKGRRVLTRAGQRAVSVAVLLPGVAEGTVLAGAELLVIAAMPGVATKKSWTPWPVTWPA